MAGTLASLEYIQSGDEGSEWYNKVNNNALKIETAFGGGLSEVGHRHDILNIDGLSLELNNKASFTELESGLATKADLGHTHEGSEVNVTHKGVTKTLQEALNSVQSSIDGLSVEAVLSAIYFSGTGANSPIVTALLSLSATAFGVFTVDYYFDNVEGSNDFTNAIHLTLSSSQIVIVKPSFEEDSNQQYLHIRAMFTNVASQSGAYFTVSQLILKYAKDLTVEEIGDYIITSPEIRSAIVRDLVGRKDFRSDIASQVNSL
jgi:hypothetical protein